MRTRVRRAARLFAKPEPVLEPIVHAPLSAPPPPQRKKKVATKKKTSSHRG